MAVASPLIWLTTLLSPIIFILNKISGFFISPDETNSISEGEIKEMATLGLEEGSINSYERDVIKNVFEMDDIEAYAIMIPKSETTIIDIRESFAGVIEITKKTGFTRFPIANDEDEIIGMINVKDLFKYHGKEENFAISKILRPLFYAPETMKIFALQERLKMDKSHMAVIVNEHGDFTGIVTLEDIIEELVGEIVDEFDKVEEELIRQVSGDVYHIVASIDVERLNEEFDLDINHAQEDYTNLNGYLSSYFGKIPKVNNKIKTDNYSLRVIKSSKKKVLEVELVLKNRVKEQSIEEVDALEKSQ